MASLTHDKSNNTYTIRIVGSDGKRRSLRLGTVPKKVAESIRLKVENLHSLKMANMPMDVETAKWVSGIGDDLAAKLAAIGLIPERQSAKLGEFLQGYIERRANDAKGGTITNLNTVRNDVVKFFGQTSNLRDITEAHADEFRTHYLTRSPKLAAATVARRLKTVRLFFQFAYKRKLITSNPFADVKVTSVLPPEKQYYISEADTLRLIQAASPVWRIVIALSRFAGLRNPSEVLSLKWEHVNFETNRMTVPSPKTEHHAGKANRVMPIFTALRPYLDEAFKLAEDGAVYVVGGSVGDGYRKASNRPGGWMNANMRTTFLKIIRRAGLKPWPRLFQNLRSSCESDLVQANPMPSVCRWLGNSLPVAYRHYVQVLESDFANASKPVPKCGSVVGQNAGQSEAATPGQENTKATQPVADVGLRRLEFDAVSSCPDRLMGDTGFEPVTSSV